MKKIICSLALFVLIGLLYSNSYAQNLPSVYTESATNRTSSSATLTGRVNPMGTATEAYFDREKTTGPYENAAPRQDTGKATVDVQVKKEILHRAAKLQIPFVQNSGQVEDDNIGFYATTFHSTFSVTKDGHMVYTLPKRNGKDNASPRGWVIKEKLMGAVIVPPKGEEQTSTRVSYLKGSDPSKCKTGLPSYRFVNLGEIYEGIELRLKAFGSNIEKLFLVKPDGHPDQIQIQVEGAKAININERGELELMTDLGTIVFTKPIAYQEISGQRVAVPVMYRPLNLETENQSSQLAYGFSLGRYDSKYPLVIDPLLASTFIGGGDYEYAYALALDSTGNVYVTGLTLSPDFPTTPGAYDTTFGGGTQNVVFISKFNADLTELLASTFLGWIYNGESTIAIDSQDNVYVTGLTGGFPATISKLNSDLTQVLGSTSLPASVNTAINSIAVGKDGSIYATGSTDNATSNFPTTPGAYDTSFNGGLDAFVSKFSSDLTQLLASTFLGGHSADMATAITVDPQGYIVVTGFTLSDDFPTTPGAYDTSFNWGFDVFVSKFNSDLTQLLGSTFLGGTYFDRGWAIAVDPQGDIVVAGMTESGNFPTTPGAYKTVFEGGIDAVNGFVSRLSSDLTHLLASTFLGQGGIGSIFLVDSKKVFVVDNNGLGVLNGNLSWLIYSTPIVGGGSMVIDADGNVYVAGYTDSQSFPTTPGAYDTSYNGGHDAFVLKMGPDLPPSYYADECLPLFPGEIWKYLKNGEQTVTRKVLNNKVNVRGVETSPVKFIEENVTEYLTSDSNGIFLHREYQPHIYISGVGWVDIDVTFIPPIMLADGEVWIGESFHSSGIARTLVLPLGQISNFDYTADSTIEAEETITVPAGTFDTIRYRGSITIYGQTLSMIRYLAKGIGVVKDVATNPQGKTATFELLSYLAPETNPPTGSITIKGGAQATKSTAVTLTLTATDDTPGAIRMCISNTATCTAWTAFASTKSWTLTSGNGTKTVNVWFKDVWGNVNATPYSDTIILDTIAPKNGTLTAVPGDTEVMLSWTGFEDTGGGIESYKLVYAKGSIPTSCSGTAIYSGAEFSYTHKGLTNGTKYGYRVCAIDKAGNISTGATASTKPRPELNPPTGSITIKGGAEATKSTAVTLALTAIDDTIPRAIRMCVSNTVTCTTWTAFATTKSWTLTSGNGTKTVNVWFQDVWDNVNATPYSDTIILDTIAPTNGTVTATPGDTQVTLDWTGFKDTGSDIGSYRVVFAKGAVPLSCSTGTVIYSGPELSTTHTELTNGTKYGYRVCAIDKAGNVSTGATASAKPIP